MPRLLLGPILRYVDRTSVTIWVETDRPCTVTILDHSTRTFQVCGHHYALVVVEGLEPGSTTAYDVELDGERLWPPVDAELPAPVIRTLGGDNRATRVVFGSCRVSAPNEPPHTLRKHDDPRGREIDALRLLALRFADEEPDVWPDLLLHLGDQVYADEVSPATLERIRERRDTSVPPCEQVANFEEYTMLYRESWAEPAVRWMLSVLPSAMIFDDHDVLDDWNISASWVRDMRQEDWWEERITGAFATYWVYQHIGNLSPAELERNELFARVREVGADGDAGDLLHRFGHEADREPTTARWSFHRDLGGVRIVTLDSRAARVLEPGSRSMLDAAEWEWAEEHLTGDVDHLVVASSLPVLMAHGLHYGEAWNEAVCDGAWGRVWSWLGERARRAADLEHWAAFSDSFDRLMGRLGEVGAGRHGRAPQSITIVSGDVHHAYLAEVAYRRELGVSSHVWQATCSPLRNPLAHNEQRVIKFGASRTGHVIARALARSAGVRDPDVRWRFVEGPVFDNQVAILDLDGGSAAMTVLRAMPIEPGDEDREPELELTFRHELSG